ncbi:PfkB family carbohydrate kinase [Niabella ginsenosidivorans]|uniref:PfkB family carbohydrate kinase n=1 Tax=Niabella ginsenosidivorans TaxID=1176587 RepID=UPI0021CDE3C8|nr:PfkB family carbohydrate kinase [Niabella ginsenosidivorans]
MEAGLLTGMDIKDLAGVQQAIRILVAKGIKTVVITLGEEGALVGDNGRITLVSEGKACRYNCRRRHV